MAGNDDGRLAGLQSKPGLEIIINGQRGLIASPTLDQALVELGFNSVSVATAINGDFIPIARRTQTRLQVGDRLEIVAARQGG